MWRPDRTVRGPARATIADIEGLNRLFSDAFTERYRRDGLSGVRVPFLNPGIWEYAIEDAAATNDAVRNGPATTAGSLPATSARTRTCTPAM